MNIEELREKYAELEKEHNELNNKYESLVKTSNEDKNKISELEEYNRKLFNTYVLSKPAEKPTAEPGLSIDDLTNKMAENFKKGSK